MVVSVPLHYSTFAKSGVTGKTIHEILTKHYNDKNLPFVKVMPRLKDADYLDRNNFLRPDTLKDTNKMELFVFDNDDDEMVVLCARLDNLGKGASGAAVQNMNLALGLDETQGLV